MGYTHFFGFGKPARGQAKLVETKYQRAIEDCQRIVRRYYDEFGGLSGYTAHCPIGAYGGLQVNGKRGEDCEEFTLREHFTQNEAHQFVKTNREPYDLVVVACLAVLKHRLGDCFKADLSHVDCKEGIDYARKVTGLKLKSLA